MDLTQETVHQPNNEAALRGAGKPGDSCGVSPIHSEQSDDGCMKRQRLRATPGGYFNQLCLYLQNDETFDHCSRNNRVSEFRGHVVLVNDTKSAGQVTKRRKGGTSDWRCTVCRRIRGRKQRGGAVQPADSGLTWMASAAGRVKNMMVAVTTSCSENWNKKKKEEEKVAQITC